MALHDVQLSVNVMAEKSPHSILFNEKYATCVISQAQKLSILNMKRYVTYRLSEKNAFLGKIAFWSLCRY